MATSFPMTNPWTDGESLTAALLFARITAPINDAAINGPLGLLGEATDTSGAVTLTALNTNYPSTAPVTFTLTAQRRVKVTCGARYSLAATPVAGRLVVTAYYVAGTVATITGSVAAPMFATTYNNSGVAGPNGTSSVLTEWTWLLPAGTYTAFGGYNRLNGGQATDTATAQYCRVEDIGAS